jgi:hypothetical protein
MVSWGVVGVNARTAPALDPESRKNQAGGRSIPHYRNHVRKKKPDRTAHKKSNKTGSEQCSKPVD